MAIKLAHNVDKCNFLMLVTAEKYIIMSQPCSPIINMADIIIYFSEANNNGHILGKQLC